MARHLRRALLPLVRHVGLVVVLLLDALRQVDRERAVGAAAPVLAAKLVERALLAVEREVGERVRLVLQLGVVLLGALLAARDDRVDVLLLELAALRVEDEGGRRSAKWGGGVGRGVGARRLEGGRYTFELKTASAPKRIMPSISSFESDFDCSTRREAEGRRQRGGDG